MRYSRLFGKTLRQPPHEVADPGHALLVQGGFIRSIGQGLYSFLPLGMRVIDKIESVIRDEMDRLGGQEVQVPLVNPYRLWWKGGRTDLIKRDLINFKDRSGRMLVLSPSHEEAMVQLVKDSIRSYRDLPILLYQLQTKFRDEERTRGGLKRTKEFTMKDAYSFHRSFSDLNNFFPKIFGAYERIFRRCGIDSIPAEAGVGYMGGEKAYEFVMPSETGDDTLIRCPQCGYAANREVAKGIKEEEAGEPGPLERITTPGCTSMAKLAERLSTDTSRLAKCLVFKTKTDYVMAVVRGDYEVSIEKLAQAVGAPVIRLASAHELDRIGLIPGFLSPLDSPGIPVVVDDCAAHTTNLVFGGNEMDVHVLNVNYGRDYKGDVKGDIAMVKRRNRCRICHGELEEVQVLELGHIFKLGDFYSRALGLSIQDESGEQLYPNMGSYGIGVGRLLVAVSETNRDDRGLVWPWRIAPYQVYLMGIGKSLLVKRVAENLHDVIPAQVLIDDRIESPGVKFRDADLIGIPIRIVVSSRNLAENKVEFCERRTGEKWLVDVGDVPETVREYGNRSENV